TPKELRSCVLLRRTLRIAGRTVCVQCAYDDARVLIGTGPRFAVGCNVLRVMTGHPMFDSDVAQRGFVVCALRRGKGSPRAKAASCLKLIGAWHHAFDHLQTISFAPADRRKRCE